MFVADAADHDNMDAARQELHDLLQKPSLAGIPLLVLGNKSDLPGALSTNDLIDRLELKVGGRNIVLELHHDCGRVLQRPAGHKSLQTTGAAALLLLTTGTDAFSAFEMMRICPDEKPDC